jgi:hypothetical protein
MWTLIGNARGRHRIKVQSRKATLLVFLAPSF